MKTKTMLKNALIMLMTGWVVMSCQDNQEVTVTDNQPVSVVNGVLAFHTPEDFEGTISQLIQDQANITQWEGQFEGFTSLHTAYLNLINQLNEHEDQSEAILSNNRHLYELTNRSGETEMIPLTDDEVLATVFNQDGLVIINGELLKMTPQTVYKKAFEGISELQNNVALDDQYFIHAKAEQLPFVKEVLQVDPISGRKIETCDQRYAKKNRKRLKGEIFSNKIGKFFSSVGARTKHQRKILGVWTAKKTKKIRLRVNGILTQTLTFQPGQQTTVTEQISYDITKNNENKIAKTFEFCLNANCKFDIEEMTNYHWCNCDDGNNRSCITEIIN